MAFLVFPKLAFPGRVFPLDVWQGKAEEPERDGTWAAAIPSGFAATARALPGACAHPITLHPSARAKVEPGYHAEKAR